MTAISLKLPDGLLAESECCASTLSMTRAGYIREAIERLNTEVLRQRKQARMARASELVRAESMSVNAEFAAVERDLEEG